MSVFGLPFLCGGIFAVSTGAGAIPIQNADSAPVFMMPVLMLVR